MIAYYVVQSFIRTRKGAIVAIEPILVNSENQAVRMAARLATEAIGVVAFRRAGDPATGDYEDATILAEHGFVPLMEGGCRLAC